MGVTTTNLIQGPAVVRIAPFGTTEPATPAAVWPAGWVDVGGTKDGVTLKVANSLVMLSVDQILDELGATIESRETTLTTTLAEATLENIARVINTPQTAVVAATGTKTLEPVTGIGAFFPDYMAIGLEGRAPGGFVRRVILRKTLSTDGTETSAKKDDQTVLSAAWKAFHVSDSVKPFSIIDATA